MSGGHWNYLFHRLEERAEYAGNVWKLLAAIEHELDYGLSGDTCYDCAAIRVVNALQSYFDSEATDASNAIRLIRSTEPECDGCKARKQPVKQQKQGDAIEIDFAYGGKRYRGVVHEIPWTQ